MSIPDAKRVTLSSHWCMKIDPENTDSIVANRKGHRAIWRSKGTDKERCALQLYDRVKYAEADKPNPRKLNMTSESTLSNSSFDNPFLDDIEVRVLGSLAEKEATTPDNYPLSLNALVNACNQLTSRDPVMSLTESQVSETLDRLAAKKFVGITHQAGARVAKYEHRMRLKWTLEQDKLAVLSILMLRGWQTAGEIRSRAGRLHEFSSVADVEKALEFLMNKYPPLVTRLALAPGTKEPRYAHLLSCDDATIEQLQASAPSTSAPSSMHKDRLANLEEEVAQLRSTITDLSAQFAEFKKQFE